MLLKKTLSLSDVDLKVDGDRGKFSGYASVFGGVDAVGDTIVRGAFATTLKRDGKPKMFFNHDWFGLPVGKWNVAKEDDHGLFVEGELTLDASTGRDVYAAMKHGTLDGLSIGGYVKSDDYDETEDGKRVIRKWSRLVEISAVTFPADSAARVELSSVKGEPLDTVLEEIKNLESIREIERYLRDARGFYKGEAAALLSRVKAVYERGDPDEGAEMKALRQIAERVQHIAA